MPGFTFQPLSAEGTRHYWQEPDVASGRANQVAQTMLAQECRTGLPDEAHRKSIDR